MNIRAKVSLFLCACLTEKSGLMADYNVRVQKGKVASTATEVILCLIFIYSGYDIDFDLFILVDLSISLV